MLKIRFNRKGKRNRAHFRIVVQEQSCAPGGRHVELVGTYNPHSKEASFKQDRIKHWIEKGAKASDSVHNLLVSKGVIKGPRRAVKMPEPEVKDETSQTPGKPEEEKKEGAKPEAKKEAAKPEEAKEEKKEEVK